MSKTRPHFKVGDRVVDMEDNVSDRATVIEVSPDHVSIKVHWDGHDGSSFWWPASDFVSEDDFDAED